MIGDLIEKHQLRRSDILWRAAESFVEGYGPISRSMAFRVLIHSGAHLINWWVRGPKEGLSDQEIRRIVKLGRDMVCYGVKTNEQWFRDNELGFIFGVEQKPSSR
jgi:hypothetical protein